MEQIAAYENINDAGGIKMLGSAIAESGMFGASNDSQGMIIALQCMSENKPPLEMAKSYHIIKGKLTKRADAMLADFRKAGGKFIFKDLKNPTVQNALVTFEDYKDFAVEYSIEDAKSAGVYNTKADSPWIKTPAAMLRARLVSETLRAIAPEIVTGVYTPEEVTQFDDVATVSKQPTKATQSRPKAKPEPKKAEVIETEIVQQTEIEKLEMLIDENRAEELINDYFVNNGAIDGKQSWRNLDVKTHLRMLSGFDSLLGAARKVQA